MTSSAGVTVFGAAFGSLRALSLAWRSASCFSRAAISFSRPVSLAGGSSPRPAPAARAVRATASSVAASGAGGGGGSWCQTGMGGQVARGPTGERRPQGPAHLTDIIADGAGSPRPTGPELRSSGRYNPLAPRLSLGTPACQRLPARGSGPRTRAPGSPATRRGEIQLGPEAMGPTCPTRGRRPGGKAVPRLNVRRGPILEVRLEGGEAQGDGLRLVPPVAPRVPQGDRPAGPRCTRPPCTRACRPRPRWAGRPD